jgi:hypothetical protein
LKWLKYVERRLICCLKYEKAVIREREREALELKISKRLNRGGEKVVMMKLGWQLQLNIKK